MFIEEIPEYDCGTSSKITVRATPCESFTTNSVEVSLFEIVPRWIGTLNLIV